MPNGRLVGTQLQLRPTAMMFNIGIVGLESVQKLEAIFHDIATLEPEERRELLTPINQNYADYQTIVHHPWVTEARQPAFDADSAASRYERMAREAQAWGNRALSLQCSVASAAILDELKDDAQAALHVLNAAEASYGKDLILARAFAKLHHRNGQHAEALEFYGETVPHIEAASPILRCSHPPRRCHLRGHVRRLADCSIMVSPRAGHRETFAEHRIGFTSHWDLAPMQRSRASRPEISKTRSVC